MGGDHSAVLVLVELHAQVVQPLDGFGSLGDQTVKQFGLCSKMAAAESVQIVDSGRIVGLVGCLDAALCHHGVGVAQAELSDDHNLGTGIVSLDGCGSTGSAAADDEDIGVIIGVLQINFIGVHPGLGLQEGGKLGRNLLALVGADLQDRKFVLFIVGVVGLQEVVLFLSGHPAGLKGRIFRTGSLHLLHGFQHFVGVHFGSPLLFDLTMVVELLHFLDGLLH